VHTFKGYRMVDMLNYGNTAQKHIDTVKRQSTDMNTVLGVYLSMVNRPCPLPPPPPNGGTDTVLELNELIERQTSSTDEERSYAIDMDDLKSHYGMWVQEATRLTRQKYDYDFFDKIAVCIDGYLNYMKLKYDRPRPYQLAPVMGKRIDMIIKEPGTASYPSGHAMDAWTFAMVLSRRHPSCEREFYAIADRVCDSRMVAGVHFRSDTKAGHMLAESALNIIQDHRLLKDILL
jgi:hypothetical protein